jgi:hypothetical protein
LNIPFDVFFNYPIVYEKFACMLLMNENRSRRKTYVNLKTVITNSISSELSLIIRIILKKRKIKRKNKSKKKKIQEKKNPKKKIQ